MLAIRKTFDTFEIMTEHGIIEASGVRMLVKVLEKEFNIDIYDSSFEGALDEIEDKIENLEAEFLKDVTPLKEQLVLLKKEQAEKNKTYRI